MDDFLDVPFKGLKALTDSLNTIRKAKLWLQVLVAMFLGIAVGLLLSPEMNLISNHALLYSIGEWMALPGKVFLAMIKMVVVPLIFASIIQGVSSAGDINQLKGVGLKVLLFFVLTTILAAIVGIAVGKTLSPGSQLSGSDIAQKEMKMVKVPETSAPKFQLKDLPRKIPQLLPQNPIDSIVKGEMIQIVVFAIIVGIGLLLLSESSSRPLLELVGSIQQVSMAIVGLAMSFAPLAVFGLLAQSLILTGAKVLLGLGLYSLSVLIAMGILYIVYLLLAFLLGGCSPFTFLKATRTPVLIGFSTNSSAATMPITVKAAEEALDIAPTLSRFIVPLGATINMGGTACYQALTTLFMAQIFGLDLPLSSLTALVFTATAASIGTPAVPGAGMIVLSSVLTSAGVPVEALPLILGVDRILERFRTGLNISGDLVACVVLNRMQKMNFLNS